MPEISIVLPSYNGEKYIRESIDSILGQSFCDWELIIVDDCSIDETLSIVNDYANRDKRIKVIHNEVNQKLPESLNIGFRQAAGKYLTWTSDDNRYLPSALEEMKSFLECNREFPMVSADYVAFGINEEIICSFANGEIYFNNCVGACFLYRREVLERIGEYNPALFLVEDYDYWLRVMFTYGKIGHLKNVLYEYRMHEDSLTETRTKEIGKRLLQMQIEYFDKILSGIRENKKVIAMYYLYFMEKKVLSGKMKNQMVQLMPSLAYDKFEEDSQKYIIFGAGKIGRIIRQELGDRAAFFVDSSTEKVGKMVDGLPVLSKNEMKDLLNQYHVMLAVGDEKIYELMEYMYEIEKKDYCTYKKWRLNRNI